MPREQTQRAEGSADADYRSDERLYEGNKDRRTDIGIFRHEIHVEHGADNIADYGRYRRSVDIYRRYADEDKAE